MKDHKSHCVELVLFSKKDGIDEAVLVKSSRAIQDWLAAQPGYLSRTLYKREDGNYADLVVWETKDLALAAGERIMRLPEAGQLFQHIQETGLQMLHLDFLSAF